MTNHVRFIVSKVESICIAIRPMVLTLIKEIGEEDWRRPSVGYHRYKDYPRLLLRLSAASS